MLTLALGALLVATHYILRNTPRARRAEGPTRHERHLHPRLARPRLPHRPPLPEGERTMNGHHFPCPCGDELADECPKCARTNPFGSMRRSMSDPSPAQRRDWWSNNFEAVMPTDHLERVAYLAQLAAEAEHGPSAGQEAS